MQIVSACLARDLPVYRYTFSSLREFIPDSEIHVITRRKEFAKFRHACGSELILWDESELIPEMKLADLRRMPFPFFPRGAGWYFQQFLKYAFLNVSNSDRHFLIWDADTVLLRPLDFFTAEGKPIYTKASEHHLPYFETFESLFGTRAEREFSFISQHQIIDKQVLRRMLNEISALHPDSGHWTWAIMRSLKGEGSNLFSEYETYGHYLKLNFNGSFLVRNLRWTRHGERWAGYPPETSRLLEMRNDLDFAAFEAIFSTRNRFARLIRRFLQQLRFDSYRPEPTKSGTSRPQQQEQSTIRG